MLTRTSCGADRKVRSTDPEVLDTSARSEERSVPCVIPEVVRARTGPDSRRRMIEPEAPSTRTAPLRSDTSTAPEVTVPETSVSAGTSSSIWAPQL